MIKSTDDLTSNFNESHFTGRQPLFSEVLFAPPLSFSDISKSPLFVSLWSLIFYFLNFRSNKNTFIVYTLVQSAVYIYSVDLF